MIFIPGGTFLMGSNRHYPEEAPVRRVSVDGFWIDRAPITNRQFRRFVEATGYVTLAERRLDAADYPGAAPEMLRPGSLVFVPPARPVPLDDWRRWWVLVFGASWRHPYGPRTTCEGLDDHPVVHIAHEDALAYAAWAGKDLPTEAEWEFAARGGLEGAEYAWGDVFMPEGRPMANSWFGRFPYENTKLHGFDRTSPVGSFPANGYGLVDMIGNVWEWTSDPYVPRHLPAPARADASAACCSPMAARDMRQPRIARRVIRGGSHLCAPSYCRRYRPAARQPQPVDSPASHLGFRCVVRCPRESRVLRSRRP